MNPSPNDLIEEVAGIIAEGLTASQLQAGSNVEVLGGPITVLTPTPVPPVRVEGRFRGFQFQPAGFYAT